MSPRTLALLLAPTMSLVVLVGRSDAGIVIFEDGSSVVCKFGPEDVTDEELVVRSMEGEQGSSRIPRRRVRWFDAAANQPTDAYFRAHLSDPLEARWEALRQRFIMRSRPVDVDEVPIPPFVFHDDPLGPVVALAHGATVRPPRGWKPEPIEDEVTSFVARDWGDGGYAPRVHVFSSEAPAAPAGEQLRWIDHELRTLAVEGGYQQQELYRLRQVPGGFDQAMITSTRARDGRELLALRRISFRAERTYFFTAYADARDFDLLRERLKRSLESFTPGR